MKNIYTIGVYNSTKETFFEKLIKYKIDTFCDIRRRRGVRGAKYSFVNSLRLQATLKEMNINYYHFLELSPSNEIREKQKKHDIQNKINKRNRTILGEVFSDLYIREHLTEKNLLDVEQRLADSPASNVAFFCVEENHKACHRSLLASSLVKRNPNIKAMNI